MELTQRERTLHVALSAAAHFIRQRNFVDARAALKLAERGYNEITRENYQWIARLNGIIASTQ